MALPNPISPDRIDVQSPVDECLLSDIVANLQYLDGLLGGEKISGISWKATGELAEAVGLRCAVDAAQVPAQFTPTRATAWLRKSGISGSIEIDLRVVKKLNNAITQISPVLDSATQSIARALGTFTGTSVAPVVPAQNTQSITRAYAALNITSIVQIVGTNRIRINTNFQAGAEWVVGDSVTIAGATSGANNGVFTVVEINRDAYPSIVVQNPSGVQQFSAAGTAQLDAWAYNLVNPADTFAFVAGERATFAGHTTGGNNGNFVLFGVNIGGNNLVVKNPSTVAATQGGAAGTCRCGRATITSSATVSGNFVVDEVADISGFSNANNNGQFRIIAVNSPAASTLVIGNVGHVSEGAASATVAPIRWVYTFSSAPPAEILNRIVAATGHTNALNNGNFEVKAIVGNTIVISNDQGVSQGSPAGSVISSRVIVSLFDPIGSDVQAGVFVELDQTSQAVFNRDDYREQHVVAEVNRSGGQNIVLDVLNARGFFPPFGALVEVQKSILSAPIVLSADLIGNRPQQAVTASTTSFAVSPVDANSNLCMFIKQKMGGEPLDLSVSLI